jgi:hypothetical protein
MLEADELEELTQRINNLEERNRKLIALVVQLTETVITGFNPDSGVDARTIKNHLHETIKRLERI